MQTLSFRLSDFHWITFYSLIILSWILLFLLISLEGGESDLQKFYGSDLLLTLCKPVESFNDWPYAFMMWCLMGTAMMAPTIHPALQTYDDLVSSYQASRIGFLSILLGFLTVWCLFAFVFSFLQIVMTEQRLLGSGGDFMSPLVSFILLFLAGLYQLSTLKKACLHKCRHPLTFFISGWQGDIKSTFLIGLKMGFFCLGCCWLLMSLAFVGGLMNIGLMLLMTIVMISEKLPKFGQYVTFPLSVLLLISALLIAIAELI